MLYFLEYTNEFLDVKCWNNDGLVLLNFVTHSQFHFTKIYLHTTFCFFQTIYNQLDTLLGVHEHVTNTVLDRLNN